MNHAYRNYSKVMTPASLAEIAIGVSWVTFLSLLVIALFNAPGTMYQGQDGLWAAWNAQATLSHGKFLDLSPYNIFSGTGSMFLPNLPWVNPGALALGLPFKQSVVYVLSYLVYALVAGGSIYLLCRRLGLSPVIGTLAAQLHILVLFPPFYLFFEAIEWYAAAPMYAQLSAVLNLICCLFVLCGSLRRPVLNAMAALGIVLLTLIGLISSVMSFPLFVISYSTGIVVLIFASAADRRQLAWKIGAGLLTLLVLVVMGLPDYYLGTIATSARTPGMPGNWQWMLSLQGWIDLIRDSHLCDNDPRTLLCRGEKNYIFHFQAFALFGAGMTAIYGAVAHRRILAAIALWYIAIVGMQHLYAMLYQGGRLGAVSVFSSHFFVWPTYAFAAIFCASAIPSAGKLIGMAVVRWSAAVPVRWLMRLGTALGVIALLVAAPAGSVYVQRESAPMINGTPQYLKNFDPEPVPIVAYLAKASALSVGDPFRGYTATIWGDPDGRIRKDYANVAEVEKANSWRLHYLLHEINQKRAGNTFSEMSLWMFNVPTAEEYGQWVSRQLFVFVQELLAPPDSELFVKKLRILSYDFGILRSMGVRFVISNEELAHSGVRRVLSQEVADYNVHLYEIANPNIANYSPVVPIVAETAEQTFSLIRQHRAALDHYVIVAGPVAGAFVPASATRMTMIKDGIRFSGTSAGRSLVLLPVQYSQCLRSSDPRIKLRRANLIQTLAEFEGSVQADITFDFGLFGSGKCRIKDGEDLKRMGLQ